MRLMVGGVHDKFQSEVVKKLLARGIDVCCLVGQGLKSSEFPNAVLLDHSDLMDPLFFEKANAGTKYALGEKVIADCREYEKLFVKNSDRFAFFNISARRRTAIYQGMLLYWYGLLQDHKIDAVFLESTPHMGWDMALYAAAKALGKDAFYIERTSIDDTVMLIADYSKLPNVPDDYLVGKSKADLVQYLGEEFYKKVFKESYWIKRSKIIVSQAGIKKSFGKKVGNFLNLAKYFFGKTEKQDRPTSFAYNFPIPRFLNVILEQYVKWHNRGLYKYYSSLTQTPDMSAKYIFFPMQFQPERTSMPLGGIFENQLLALQILSQAAPSDWKIYVKEHPRQLKTSRTNSIHYRNRKYYQALTAIPKVVLLDIDLDNQPLIERSQVTAVLSGSSGWESILKGKACIIFGYPWYAGCASCFRVDSAESGRRAIEQILQKSPETVAIDLLRFLCFYKENFITSVNCELFASKSERKYDELVENLAAALAARIGHDPALAFSK